VNFVVDVDFLGFVGVVDALSGIWVDVDRRYFTPPEADHMEIDVQAGYQRLDGRDALAFARYRHDDVHGDFARIARQQQVLAGLKKQVASSGVRSNVPGLFRVMKKNTSIVAGGGDEVSARVIYDYVRLATSLSSKDVYQIEFEGSTGESSTGASIVTFEEAKLEGAVEAFLNPSASARETTADQLVGKASPDAGATKEPTKAEPAAALPPKPSSVTVTVKNGSGVTGVARKMGEQLRNVGYQASVPDGAAGSADNPNYANTRVQYATASAQLAAEALADHIPGASAEAKTPANAFDTQLLVIVGDTGLEYRADADDAVGVDGGPSGGVEYAGNKVPDKAAAKTTIDAEYGRDDFATVGALSFPLLYPTVREQTSTYEEVRPYEVIKGKARYAAFRMVAKTGQGDYWGLQGTNWPDPPVLEGATREVTRGARRYQLFFNGTKLHMVAWKQGTGTYWVSNSVLDKLSNETMLAIADGIKPYA
ncbi:MAG: LytR family transcriptional regulator, partial [Thermoleophilia bacterium]|nr:LytR family transcriptional regulator [Thermoleophilia bacterium]